MEKNCKYFICYLYDDYKIKSLQIILPETRAYVKDYDEKIKQTFFKDHGLLNNQNIIWDKVSTDIERELNSGPVYNKKLLKTKKTLTVMKLQIFTNKKYIKQTNNTCLAVTSFDSIIKIDENYYPQVFLKECKYIQKSNQTYYW